MAALRSASEQWAVFRSQGTVSGYEITGRPDGSSTSAIRGCVEPVASTVLMLTAPEHAASLQCASSGFEGPRLAGQDGRCADVAGAPTGGEEWQPAAPDGV